MSFPLKVEIDGLPINCIIHRIVKQLPSAYADNRDDYDGYTELDFDIEGAGEAALLLGTNIEMLYDRVEKELLNKQLKSVRGFM